MELFAGIVCGLQTCRPAFHFKQNVTSLFHTFLGFFLFLVSNILKVLGEHNLNKDENGFFYFVILAIIFYL